MAELGKCDEVVPMPCHYKTFFFFNFFFSPNQLSQFWADIRIPAGEITHKLPPESSETRKSAPPPTLIEAASLLSNRAFFKAAV